MLINGVYSHQIEQLDRGFQYGDGLFETIAIHNGQAVFLDHHLARLQKDCNRLKIPFPGTELLTSEVEQLSKDSNKAILKIILTRGVGGRGYRQPDTIKTTRVLSLHPYPTYPDNYKKHGIHARFCDTRLGINPALAGIKHLNRLEQVLARSEWTDPAIQEGIMRDFNDNIIEGTMTNLFYIKGKRIYTAPIIVSGVSGIMRGIIMSLCANHQLIVIEQNFNQEDLLAADEIFVCNSIIDIWPITELASISFPAGEITGKIQSWLAQYQSEQSDLKPPINKQKPSHIVFYKNLYNRFLQFQYKKLINYIRAAISVKTCIIIFALLLAIVSAWLNLDYQKALHQPAVLGNAVTIEISKGDSFKQITNKLFEQNIAFKPLWFRVITILNKTTNKLKAGEYELTQNLTLPQIIDLFVQGKTKHYAITFPEGWTFKELLEALKNNPNLDHSLNTNASEQVMMQLGIKDSIPEGLFFPDTYFFEKHSTDIELLKRAYNKMQQILEQEWKNRAENLPIKTPYEALTLASIIEKETAAVTERDLISGVFSRRLKTGMLLQTDPTVIYGMNDNYQGNITRNDLKTATAYNTYIILGLPPTPIAIPGQAAINAALHPDNSNNIYFVARGDGTHVFSATLEEHNLAVDNFQRKKP
jgi:UPF0755 protein